MQSLMKIRLGKLSRPQLLCCFHGRFLCMLHPTACQNQLEQERQQRMKAIEATSSKSCSFGKCVHVMMGVFRLAKSGGSPT